MEQRNAITAENHNFLKDVGLGLFQHGDDQQIIMNDEDVDVDNNGKVVDQVDSDPFDVDQVDVDPFDVDQVDLDQVDVDQVDVDQVDVDQVDLD